MSFNITELKKHLGPGLGLRKNRYMIEIPNPFGAGEVLNILCQSAGLPERNMTTTEMWHKGRKYNVRGETDYGGEYEISIIDDNEMKIRNMFDKWMKIVDDSNPMGLGLGVSSFEDPSSIGLTDMPAYTQDINIWQMNSDKIDDAGKVYGYKLQNAFPKSIGIVTLDDTEENSLSQFSVVFAYSEFTPLTNAMAASAMSKVKQLSTQIKNVSEIASNLPNVASNSSSSLGSTVSSLL